MIDIDTNKCLALKTKKEKVQCIRKKINGTDFCGYHKNSKDNIYDYIKSIAKPVAQNTESYSYNELKNIPLNEVSVNRLLNTLKNKYKLINNKCETFNKEQIVKIILNEMEKEDLYQQNIDKIIKIQSHIRGYNIYKRRGTINNEDIYTLDNKYEIPGIYYYELLDGKFRYCFDIRTLAKLIEMKNPANPYTSSLLTYNQITDIQNKIEHVKKLGKWDIIDDVELNTEQKFVQKMIDVFHLFDMLDNYTDYKWFEELPLPSLKRLYKYAKELWEFRAQLADSEKIKIINGGVAFNLPMNVIMSIRENKKRQLQNIILDEFRRFATEGIDRDEKKLGVMLILTALTGVSNSAAYALPQYAQ